MLAAADIPVLDLVWATLRSGLAVFSWKAEAAQRVRPREIARALAAPAHPQPPTQDDLDQFNQEIVPYLDAALGYAHFLTRGDAVAEDIVQDAFIRALRGFSGFHGDNPKAWLFTIVRNCFLSEVGSRTARAGAATITLTDEMSETIAGADASADSILIGKEESATLQHLLEALPQPLSEVLVFREVEEMSYREIAIVLGVPIGTVMSRLARARNALAAAWRKTHERGLADGF